MHLIYIQSVPEKYKHNIKEALYDDSFRKDIILVFIFAQIILNTVYFMLFAVINFILVTLEVGISAIIQLSVSPLNAII